MSTTTIKTFPEPPYYDDFNETKNYHRVLYRPGYAVQARELTQMQTAMQAQIDRFGQYAFKHGSRVVGGKVTVNTQYDFIKIDSSFTHSIAGVLNSDSYLSQFVGTTITGSNNSGANITARVIAVIASDGTDPNTLYIKYESSGGANRTVQTFAAGEEFSSSGSPVYYGQVQSSGTPIGQGSSVNIEEGVYFLSGTFAYVPPTSLILDKYSNTPSYVIGLNVIETVVDTDTDASLTDNAQGTPNEAAPGATRYKISTAIVKESLTNLNSSNTNYVTLLRVDNGKIQVDNTDKSDPTAELTKRLAKRTFEESGNYAVKQYQLDIKDHLIVGSNNGYLSAADGGVDGKYAIGVEPGVSYVQGFRNESVSTKYLVIDKPRAEPVSVNTDTTANVATPVGNYVKLLTSTVHGAPDVTAFTLLNLKDATGGTGNTIGTARVRAIENVGDTVSSSDASPCLRLHLFDITMNVSKVFSETESVSQGHSSGETFKGDISDSTALRYDIGNDGLVFKLPYSTIKTLFDGATCDTEYTVKRDFTTQVTSNQCTISIPSGQGHFTNVNTATMIAVGGGAVDTTPTFVGASNDGVTTLTFSTVAANGTSVRVSADIEIAGDEKVQKEKLRQNNAVASSVAYSAALNGYPLGKSDIIRIVSVVDSTGTNVTERFILDNGQRANYYDNGRLVLKTGTSPVSGALTITFDYYTHGAGDYFTVDSYPTADYKYIPSFSSQQGTVQLRDCIDFRPRKADNATDDFTSTGGSVSSAPDPAHAVSMFISYYMPRIDKLFITKEGELKIATGVPSDTPKAPKAPEDSMGLYDLRLRPYGFDAGDVIPKLIDNKRYTMRDIGKIDKRVKNLEYYTSLSLLEQQASNTQLFDAANFSRTKNGFLVDGFRGHNIGNPSNPDYQCAMDKSTGTLRPMYDEKSVNLIRKDGDTGTIVQTKSLMTLPYTKTTYINQPYASLSVNVNPYNVFTWSGTMTLSPSSDDWKETDIRPDVIINDDGLYNQFLEMVEENGIAGTVWNEWETNWTGVEVDVTVESEFVNGTGGLGQGDFWWEGEQGRGGGMNVIDGVFNQGGREKITTTTATTTTEHQARTGMTTSVSSSTTTRESNNRVVEVNFIPFMRSRKIFFKAELLKPNTKVYPFFNDISVRSYVKPEAYQEFADRTEVKTYEGHYNHPDIGLSGQPAQETNGAFILTSDSTGVCTGSFVIPRTDILKFKTGSRTFKLTDSESNNTSDGSETTFSEAVFTSSGLIESIQKEVISTKVGQLVTNELGETRVVKETTVETTVEYTDPLAQTFLIDTEGGIFCKSLSLYFRTSDPDIAVRASIRAVENGIPTQRIVPGADKVIYPGQVNISEDASAVTEVEFDYPIFLAQNQEYAIVLMAQSDLYEAWVAEMGGFDVTDPNNRITKQPYNGVFFTSANASTWTPEQSRDLKFKLNRCEFSGSGAELNLVHDMLPAALRIRNPMTSTINSGIVTVQHKNHGMQNANNPKVWFSGVEAFNGLAAANLEGTHDIIGSSITHDSYQFTARNGDTATATGSGGGGAVYATENRQMDMVRNVIQDLQIPGTQIRYYLTPYSEQEVANVEGEILANQNVKFSIPKSIASPSNTSSTTKTYNLRCVFTTERSTLSPVIDMDRASLFTIQNRVIDNPTGDELSPTGGNQLARYITKKVELAEEADKIDVFLNINRPRSANVDLYWRVIEGGSSTDITTVAWQPGYPNEAISVNDNPSVFKEVQYEIDPPGSFGTMQFKIVMRSSNSATVPLVKDFRAIAST
jgi:hypothetical protein